MTEIKTASDAIALIESRARHGLTPVMRGTTFARRTFRPSQFGTFLFWEDDRGMEGVFRAENVEKVLDFVDLQEQPVAVGTWRHETAPVPGLLEAATAALTTMRSAGWEGKVVDDLAMAVAVERARR